MTTEYGDAVQRIAVPAYFYATWMQNNPDAEWERMQTDAPYVKYAVLNPASSPGTTKSAEWATQVKRAQAAGIKIVGYVTTSYTNKTKTAIMAEVVKYINWYKVDGIFFDEVSSEKSKQPFYVDLRNRIGDLNNGSSGANTVILNCGTIPDESYMLAGDAISTFEGSEADYASHTPAPWQINYPSSRFWHIVYGVTHLDDVLALTRRRRAGLIYLTPDALGEDYNPYNTLPPEDFWDTVLTHVRQG